MPEINILSPHLADLIAAGEVVERPASVIKELCENSFDAGAKNVTIEIKSGGMTFIRVIDDGCGMSPEDAGICFLRHATSKLKTESGLECIGTMGFRGEALAAIASVSRIELITRKQGTDIGTRVILEAGEITEMAPCGCPEGTSVTVRDLFHNTPARLKFMKSDRSEATACVNIALRCALGTPNVSVKLIKDGDEEFFSPGDGKISSCTYSLLGREISKELIECSSDEDGISVTGFVGSPKAGHGNRAKQFFFCNGRCIKSQLLQAAVEQAYKNSMLTGRYPSCVIYISINPGAVDVNVHPAKTEVKFRDERRIFDVVYYAALSSLQGEQKSHEIKLPQVTKQEPIPKKDFFKSMGSAEFKEKYSAPLKSSPSPVAPHVSEKRDTSSITPDRGTISWRGAGAPAPVGHTRLNDSFSSYNTRADLEKPVPKAPDTIPGFTVSPPEPEKAESIQNTPITKAETAVEPEVADTISEVFDDFRLIGEMMKTYILVEKGDSLLLIDKHAAHERMIFDRLKEQGHEIMSQALLLPVPLKLSDDEMDIIEQNSELLSSLGFEIDPYGADSVIIRGVPADTDPGDASAMIEEICEKLKKGSHPSGFNAIDEIFHTVACKAAIKAGYNTSAEELLELSRQVVSGKIKYCPHGRPVCVTLTKKQLDKEFSRIV